MAENKTKPTGASVEDYLASRANEQQAADSRQLMTLLASVTGEEPVMWGPSIVGYGRYRYTYESGRTGEAPVVGFAIRGRETVVYLVTEGAEQQALLAKLGKHRIGKVCVYYKKLADLDLEVLERLVENTVEFLRRRYP